MTDPPRLTPEMFDKFLQKETMNYARPRPLIVSRYQYIVFDVAGRPESWLTASRPVRLRLKSAWGWIKYCRRDRNRAHIYDDPFPPTWRTTLDHIKSELRITTHRVLTPEAKREIAWRHAEIGRINQWRQK